MSGSLDRAPYPATTPMVDETGLITRWWDDWFLALTGTVQNAPVSIGSILSLPDQAASIGTTDVTNDALAEGWYRVTTFVRITVPASVSSSLIVEVNGISKGVTYGFIFDAIVGNTVDSVQSETKLMKVDGSSLITMQTTYVSVGTAMEYDIDVTVEQVRLASTP